MKTEQDDVSKALVGKTIVKVEVAAINAWVLHFSDGSKQEICTEKDWVPFLYLDDVSDYVPEVNLILPPEWSPDFEHCSISKGCLLEDGHKAKCSFL